MVAVVILAAVAIIDGCQRSARDGAEAIFPDNDKKKHCFGACHFTRCVGALPPSFGLTVIGMFGWEITGGWQKDSWNDIYAGTYGMMHTYWPQSCAKVCDKCPIK